ncbi:MAG: glycyl-radical enzyme activating protein [Acidobacteriia bacterium]|nr:glycyl-radical enzyme activating protein [Terriglobia bacterium]
METRRPLIIDIKRDSREDGPGIRSVVFFKGCPLRCVFCHNPEAQQSGLEIAFAEEHCVRCGACQEACPRLAIDLDRASRIDRESCDHCGRCVEACPEGALRMIGTYWPVENLVPLLLRDVSFYRHSGGGVTLSGGECTMFPDYVRSLLQRLKACGIHTALETSGYFDYEVFARKILPYLDLVLFDIKIIDREESLRYLGRSNESILNNLRRLLAQDTVEVRPRVPVIPEITDSRDNFSAVVNYLCEAAAREISLVPYNPLGAAMYTRLGRAIPDVPSGFMKPEREEQTFKMFREIIERKRGQRRQTENAELPGIPVPPAVKTEEKHP